MRVLGVVTARGGSVRAPNKNKALLGGKPLVAWSIEVGMLTCARVVTTTDDNEIADIANSCGSQVVNRPSELASGRDFKMHVKSIIHAVNEVIENDKYGYNAVLLLQPTSPFRTVEDVRGAIDLMDKTAADTVISVVEFKTVNYLFGMGHAGRLRDMSRFEKTFKTNGAIYLIKLDYLLKGGDWYGDHAYGYVMPASRSIDIDTHADFSTAQAMLDAGEVPYVPRTNKERAPL